MSRQRAIAACVVAMIALVIGLPLVLLFRSSRARPMITEENCLKLRKQKGMTRAGVEALFGVPPGDYGRRGRTYHVIGCAGPTCKVFYNIRRDRPKPTRQEIDHAAAEYGLAIWWGEEYAIAVQFDENDRVAAVGYGHAISEPGLWDRLKERFGR
jgi:hypothetical protein